MLLESNRLPNAGHRDRHRAEDQAPTRIRWASPFNAWLRKIPTFRVHTDEDSGQTIIDGMGELHLEVIVDRMFREYKVEANVGRPQVAYRETITVTAQAEGRFVRQSGGHGQFGDVWIRVEPLERGKGFEFVNGIVGGAVPSEYIRPTEEGIRETLENGVVAGYPMVDVRATLYRWLLSRGGLL